ncbi:helix-turn-helix transcriptional regulator [Prauserella muralis]|uniref:Uncharacterized protein n=1 Tax=Prauserella muralis TaxID=588067 RepID=A0A2V4AZI8_9PSEU|nr:helix-turn-helix transcriptional regulator [Prauserella muralis]PXY27410.1 hypothetical protein BAY60_13325 [Prauserella muralis]TWE22893.1 DNA-binding XRE family transcriptional regulator [Prauserella muralis]
MSRGKGTLASPDDARTFIAALVELRHHQGLTATQVAARIGTARETVSTWETGRRIPLLHHVIAYARAIGVRLDAQIVVPLHTTQATDPASADAPLPGIAERR